jgi:hypothetical protein
MVCRTAGTYFESGAGDTESIRQPDGGGADQLPQSPGCCVVRGCPTSHRGPCTVRARDPGRGPSRDQAHDTGDECRSGRYGKAGGFGHPPVGRPLGLPGGTVESRNGTVLGTAGTKPGELTPRGSQLNGEVVGHTGDGPHLAEADRSTGALISSC